MARLDERREWQRGVAEARLYGHDPQDGIGGAGAPFLLLDEPDVYGLPPDPVVTTRDLPAMWKKAGGDPLLDDLDRAVLGDLDVVVLVGPEEVETHEGYWLSTQRVPLPSLCALYLGPSRAVRPNPYGWDSGPAVPETM